MRYGLVSALYVTTKLGSIAGLVVISFLFHYFLIVAFLPLDDAVYGRAVTASVLTRLLVGSPGRQFRRETNVFFQYK